MGHLTPKRARSVLRGYILWYGWNMLNPPGILWLHAGPGGRLLLKTEVHWTNISGIIVRTRNTQTFLSFRRRTFR